MIERFKIYSRLLGEGAALAWGTLVTNRLRTFLSLLGITIGIFTIISIFTLVDGLERSVRNAFASLGDNTIMIQKMPWGPEDGDTEYAWWKYVNRPELTYAHADALKRRMTTAETVTFFAWASRLAEYGRSSAENVGVTAVSPGFGDFINVDIALGRSFSDTELRGYARVAMLGHDVAESLFGIENPIGKEIKVAGMRATVIGVLEKEGQSIVGSGTDSWVIVPVNFGRLLMDFTKTDVQIALKPRPGVSVKEMENEADMHMRSIRRLRPGEARDFSLNKSSMLTGGVTQIFDFLSLAGLIIGGFSILVGGFSIANIMFVSVRERTPIIGIQKALGAKRSFILFQFLFESVALCVVGGAIGLFFIWIIAFAASMITGFDLGLTLGNIAIGVGFSVAIGLVSGVVPASLAARMEPVEAIRTTV
ncbi:MAG TPA: ABC transporter permease [Cryomorphaceae bacterium]|nr:ABC transporter permease [Cryomorphaceae bacterium]